MTKQRHSGRQHSDQTNAFQNDSSFEIKKLAPGDRLCHLYQTDQEHRELLTRFMRLGLERNEKVLCIADAGTAETVKSYLQDDGADLAKYVESGQFAIISVSESYLSGGVFEPDMMIELLKTETDKALKEGYLALRVAAEMKWALRGVPGSERLMEYEAKLNEFLPGSKALVIFQYDCRCFEPAMLLDVLATHPIVAVGSEVYDNFSYLPPEQFLSSERDGVLLDRWLDNLKKAKAHNKRLQRSYQALCTERDRFVVTLRSIGDGVITTDTEGRVVALNRAAEELTGWPEQEAVGTAIQKVFHIVDEQTRERCVNPVQKILETEETIALSNDSVLIARDGTERILEDTTAPIRDEAGNTLGVVLVFKEVTEDKRSHKEIQEREKKFQGLLERLREAAYRMSLPDGTYEYFNPAAKAVFGYSTEEFLREPLLIRRIMHPDFADYFEDVWADLLRGKVPPTYEYKVIDPDGNERWIIQSNNGIFDETGRIVAIEGVCSDITEFKRVEAALNVKTSAMESSISGIAIGDLDGKIAYVNPAALRLWGYDHEEEVRGKRVRDFWITEKEAEEAVRIAAKTGSWIGELVARRKDGAPLDVQAAIALVRESDGTPIAVMGSFLDISERKRAEEALLQAKEEWERTFDAVPDLICILDENNRILRANRAMAEVLGFSPEEAVGKVCYQVIHGSNSPPDYWPHLKLLRDGGVHSAEVYDETLGGHLYVTVSPLADSEGRVMGCVHVVRNISDQKAMEATLRESEEKFSSAFQFAPVPMAITSLNDGRIVEVNDAFLKSSGYKREEVLGKTEVEIGTWKDQNERACQLQQMEKEVSLVNLERDLPRKDGSLRHGLFSAVMIHLQGKPMLLSAFNDITQQKQAEEALREHEYMMRSILVATPVGLVLTENRRIKWANEEWEKMFGFKDESEYVGKPTSMMYGSDAEYMTARQAVYSNLENGIFGETHTEFMKTDGTSFRAYLRSTYLDRSDASKGTVSAISDVTEIVRAERARLESEQRYRALFEDSRDAVFVTSRDGTILDVNQACCELFGYDKNEFQNLLAKQTYADTADRKIYQEAIEKAGSIKDFPIRLRKKDGTVFEALLTASVRYGKNGEILGYQGIMRDVTEQKKLEKQLLQAQKMESIGILAGGIAHDFNNLLQIISGYTEMLHPILEKKGQSTEDLDAISHAAERGAELVRQLLTFSRKVDSKFEPCNLNKQIRRTRKLLYRTIPKMVDIEMKLDPLVGRIQADAGQIEQVLVNLGLNASDAMPLGGRLSFETRNVTLDDQFSKAHPGCVPGRYVQLTVSDTGHGMDKEVLEHIFEPFFTTKGLAERSGLGLSTVFGIVKMHGGYITCQSRPGKGTTFDIYLPVAEETELPVETTKKKSMPLGGTETILVVDDEELIQELAKRILEDAGYSVIVAGSGKEALEIYTQAERNIALVILDLIMPEMGGKQCLEELLRIDPQVKALVASGFAVNGKTKMFLDARAKGMVSKPFKIGELLGSVRSAIDGT